jgi:hypothetical protein
MDDYPSDSPTGKYKAAHILFTARKCYSSSFVSLSNNGKKSELTFDTPFFTDQPWRIGCSTF